VRTVRDITHTHQCWPNFGHLWARRERRARGSGVSGPVIPEISGRVIPVISGRGRSGVWVAGTKGLGRPEVEEDGGGGVDGGDVDGGEAAFVGEGEAMRSRWLMRRGMPRVTRRMRSRASGSGPAGSASARGFEPHSPRDLRRLVPAPRSQPDPQRRQATGSVRPGTAVGSTVSCQRETPPTVVRGGAGRASTPAEIGEGAWRWARTTLRHGCEALVDACGPLVGARIAERCCASAQGRGLPPKGPC
jgi:hypothetical protein